MKKVFSCILVLMISITAFAQTKVYNIEDTSVEIKNTSDLRAVKFGFRGGLSASKLFSYKESEDLENVKILPAYFVSFFSIIPIGQRKNGRLIFDFGYNVKGIKERAFSSSYWGNPIDLGFNVVTQLHCLDFNFDIGKNVTDKMIIFLGIGNEVGIKAIDIIRKKQKYRESYSVFKNGTLTNDFHLNIGISYHKNDRLEFLFKYQHGLIPQFKGYYSDSFYFANLKLGLGVFLK